MKKIIFILTFFVLAGGNLLAQKPVLPDFHADPSFHQWDGKYWIYPSTDEPGSTSWLEMKRWHAYSSQDLKHWKNEGQIFSLEDISWADQAAFAPDIIKKNDQYYFFYPAGFQIGVATSKNPNGPFKDPLGRPLIEKEQVEGVLSFDPCVFEDEDGRVYLFYGGGEGVAYGELNADLLSFKTAPVKIPLRNYGEGIWVHKKDGLYYFSYPIHIERDGKVKQLLAYCTSDKISGPYEYRGIILDNNGRNSHHSIAQIKDKWYLFYHIEGNSPYERQVCIDELEYFEDGSIKEVKMTDTGISAVPF
ncbi:family 43 glycosylhydrolase [Persicobacter diffluens]|uniref:Glycosyl hydrolase family 43 n=1 Tax=Persicobacter diffluens TaxID=981 RepID=A0AAN4W498_9BACT|nr:hypothetical protein PEDI_49630 [Persicobacter diffluens]